MEEPITYFKLGVFLEDHPEYETLESGLEQLNQDQLYEFGTRLIVDALRASYNEFMSEEEAEEEAEETEEAEEAEETADA